jgi:hypothetical protein
MLMAPPESLPLDPGVPLQPARTKMPAHGTRRARDRFCMFGSSIRYCGE